MQGRAYVFRRRNSAIHLGHVGWGIQTPGGYYCGATEGKGDRPSIPPGEDNGCWTQDCADERQMMAAMRRLKYEDYKCIAVGECRPEAARNTADAQRTGGYSIAGNDCLDHVVAILRNYGLSDEDAPLARWLNAEPNYWFERFTGDHHDVPPDAS